MKRIFLFLFLLVFSSVNVCFSQTSDSLTVTPTVSSNSINPDTFLVTKLSDSALRALVPDKIDWIPNNKMTTEKWMRSIGFLHLDKDPVFVYQKERDREGDDLGFYVILAFYFFLGLLRVIFGRYFSNMFKVFFNTSLRQNQLTDQLKQDKLPSLFFNAFFMCVASVYIYLLMSQFGVIEKQEYVFILYAMLALAAVYFIKFLALLFVGWISGFSKYIENYIFVVFLINKIMAIFLLPLITFIAFSSKQVSDLAMFVSYLLIVLLFILRYLRGFNLVQHSMKLSKFHFLIYVAAVELLPVLLIYRFMLNILMKSH